LRGQSRRLYSSATATILFLSLFEFFSVTFIVSLPRFCIVHHKKIVETSTVRFSIALTELLCMSSTDKVSRFLEAKAPYFLRPSFSDYCLLVNVSWPSPAFRIRQQLPRIPLYCILSGCVAFTFRTRQLLPSNSSLLYSQLHVCRNCEPTEYVCSLPFSPYLRLDRRCWTPPSKQAPPDIPTAPVGPHAPARFQHQHHAINVGAWSRELPS
jgi:hypothetical protein